MARQCLVWTWSVRNLNARVYCNVVSIDTECTTYKDRFASRTRIQITQWFQGEIDNGSRGVHKSNEIYVQRLQFCVLALLPNCLTAYDRFAAPQIRPAVKHTCYSIPSQVFSYLRQLYRLYAMHGWHEASPAVLLSNFIAVSSLLWRRIHWYQQCSTLSLVVTANNYCQPIVTTTLLLSWCCCT